MTNHHAQLPDLSKTLLIGLGHKARHGKDTVAGMLARIFSGMGIEAKHYAFAHALYDHCRSQHGMGPKDAPLLQQVGVAMRGKDPNVWIRTCLWKIATDAPKIAMISDVRFLNEAACIADSHGLTVKVSRYGLDGKPYVDPSRPANHISETELDGYTFDCRISNLEAEGVRGLYPKVLRVASTAVELALERQII